MGPGRLEAFSDGVFAIIITIMVLELKVPHGEDLAALAVLWPVFLSYILSFVYVGIYWNNHHHLIHAVHKVSGPVMWANLHLLFWLSLFPFCTGWTGENHFSTTPVAVYGVVLLMAAVSYTMLVWAIKHSQESDKRLEKAIGPDWKGKLSMALYVAGIIVAHLQSTLGFLLYCAVAAIWFIPDRRLEKIHSE
jgi:uncharacterized membrane protein